MPNRRGHIATRIAIGAVAVMAFTMSAAWACTSLATVDLASPAGKSGTVATGKIAGFSSSSATEIHWATLTGPLLATVTAGSSGSANFKFTVPQGAPGYYTVIAVQDATRARATYALNNPAPVGSGGAASGVIDQRTGAQAPNAVVYDPAASLPSAASVAAHHEALGTITPAGSRSADVFARNGHGSSVGTQLGVMLMAVGFASMVSAGAAVAVLSSRRKATQRR